MSDSYKKFLLSKRWRFHDVGICEPYVLHESLFDFQRIITDWAIRKGRCALFEDCGLGKTRQQLQWADAVVKHTGRPVIIFTPLAVSAQTIREAKLINVEARIAIGHENGFAGIIVTNYEKLHKFDPSVFAGVVLDESSILKSYEGAFRTALIESFSETPFKLACTATPAPNDYMELGNHAEFLGVMSRSEMLSTFFIHDGGQTAKWRLKGHAEEEFWKWVCSWAVFVRKPSDIGFEDGGFELPSLEIKNHVVQSNQKAEDALFALPASSLSERRKARAGSLSERCELAASLANQNGEQWIVWCDLNSESKRLAKSIEGAVEITGSDSEAHKVDAMLGFVDGRYRVLVTKPSIAGFGVNMQCCHNEIFVGLSDSYESFYQATRRCWRFGQAHPVTVHVITSHLENAVLENIRRKEREHQQMASEMMKHMETEMKRALSADDRHITFEDVRDTQEGNAWKLIRGDCVTLCKKLADDSVHYSIFSPPFASLYTYSNSEQDMGNCRNHAEFHEHFRFLVSELYRVLMPGRLVSFHCMNLPTSKAHNGYIGIVDFRGQLIRTFVEAGFIYHSEVTIWKDPVTAMQRTKALGLLHKQLKKDSCMSRQGIADYLVTMRKPGSNHEAVAHTNESFPVDVWQCYASPVWMDINPSDTLQRTSAREERDEKHICPLQLQVIRRALELWTNPGDLVLSPFAGIGSEGFESIKTGRRFIGFELKGSYFQQAVENLRNAEAESKMLF